MDICSTTDPVSLFDNSRSQIDLDNRSMKGLKISEASEAASWDWWLYNISAAAMTTGAIFDLQARHFVEWNPSG